MNKTKFLEIRKKLTELQESGEKSWWATLANEYGYHSKDSIRKQFNSAKFRFLDSDGNLREDAETPEDNSDSSGDVRSEKMDASFTDNEIKIEYVGPRILTQEELIAHHKINLEDWKIKEYRVGTYPAYRKDRKVRWVVNNGIVETGDVDDSGKLLVATVVTIKLTLVPKEEQDYWDESHLKQLQEYLQSLEYSPLKVTPSNYVQNGKALIIPFADFHYGLTASEFSTNNEYNTRIAEDRLSVAAERIYEKVKDQKFEKIYLVLGNDFLNSDNISNTTSHGTPQDSNPDWFILIKEATRVVIEIIDYVRAICPNIVVINVPSNHDMHSMFGIMETVAAYYKDFHGEIEIVNSPVERSYFTFGSNLLGFAHDINFTKKALELMTTEAGRLWSKADNKYFFLAHLHQAMQYQTVGDLQGYRFPTMSGWSRWSSGKGYVSSLKPSTQVFVLDEYEGVETVYNIFVE